VLLIALAQFLFACAQMDVTFSAVIVTDDLTRQ
jgi:hypothetical protein